MNSEFDLYHEATDLSQSMLQALADGDIESLNQQAELREKILNEIHERLANKTTLPEDQVTLLKELLALNEQLVSTVYAQRQAVGEQLTVIQVGKKATESYRKQV